MWWSFSKVGCFLFYSFPTAPQSGAIPWVAPGDPWTPQWSLALSLIPLIIPRPVAPDCSPPQQLAAVAFIPCNGTDGTGTVWPGVNGRLKHAYLSASPLPLAGEESWRKGNLSSGQERQSTALGAISSRAAPRPELSRVKRR